MKILAVSSAGGHWEQLLAIRESFADHEVLYATTQPEAANYSGLRDVAVIHDCNRHTPFANILSAVDAFSLAMRFQPDFVVTTGAAPGLIALVAGKIFGARGVWIDSVANSERLSLSGKLASRLADLHLTQWKHLSAPGGPRYFGSVL